MDNGPHNNFYAKRYLEAVDVLKKYGLWNLEDGLLFLPILQHCMPPPSLVMIRNLLGNLVDCQVDTDWAPLEQTTKLRNKLYRITRNPNFSDDDNLLDIGESYPITYGISRIKSLALCKAGISEKRSTLLKQRMIITFVEELYLFTCESKYLERNGKELYLDTYQLRDVIIYECVKSNNLNFTGSFNKDLDKKVSRTKLLRTGVKKLGSKDRSYRSQVRFWDDPPHAPFTLSQEEVIGRSSQTQKNPIEPEEQVERKPNTEELLRNNEQQKINIYATKAKWARSNVRSLADPNQLSWSAVFQYWEYLLQKKEKELFLLSVVSFLTGIPKKRWINSLVDSELTLESLKLHEKSNSIVMKIDSGAAKFIISDSKYSDTVILKLPNPLRLNNKIIEKGLKEESRVRSFNQYYSGPSLMLNNIARSGHVLLRKDIKGETLAFIMSGRVPIEFKARSAYLATDNVTLNELLNECVSKLSSEVSKQSKYYPLTSTKLQTLKGRDDFESNHIIGSQLTGKQWSFSSYDISPYSGNDIEKCIKVTNQLNLYYYWMLQFFLAARAKGDATESINIGGFWLHKDKDSDEYFESKVLLTSSLLSDQLNEVIACKNELVERIKRRVYKFDQRDFATDEPCYFETKKNQVTATTLTSKNAIQLTKHYWSISPAHGRPNAHRHQASGFIHKKLGERYADAWLGHHIDGWDYTAPDSSSSVRMLHDLLKVQEEWLEQVGFHLIRNPLK